MSGPKVINIEAVRRRQQREALARLRLFDGLLDEWRRARERVGTLTPDTAKEAEAIRRRLAVMRDAADWMQLLSELEAREAFFRNEMRVANEEHVARVRMARERRRRTASAAASLAQELRSAGLPPSADLNTVASEANQANDAQIAQFETQLQSTIAILAERRHAEEAKRTTGRKRTFAATLMTGTDAQETISQWLARSPQTRAEDARLDTLLAEIEASGSVEETAPFLKKVEAIDAESTADRRTMLLDSLLLELGDHRRRQREKGEVARKLMAALARLEPFQSDAADLWREKINAALAAGADEQQLATSVQAWCDQEAAQEDARLRRDAVLRALTALGYEVREGMSAAWAENGRIVVRNPNEPNYGVELAAASSGPALQARVVAFEHPGRSAASTIRDREVETSWCSDFAKLQRTLSSDGFAVRLQHASAPGAVTLKVVPDEAGQRPSQVQLQDRGKMRER